MANDDIDMMNDDESGDELESAGMHLIGEEEDDEGDEEAVELAPKLLIVEEEEAPKDGLAELEELERSVDAERNAIADEDDDEGF